jgi:TetR/AcrR family transcriptional regulator
MVASRSPETDVRAGTIAAATRLFAAHGFEGTALQDIADAVGVSKPAILHHFPSKEHIRQAVLDSMLAHWNGMLPRLLLAATASGDRFEAVFGELHRFFASDPDRARLIVRETLDRPAEMRKVLRGTVHSWHAAIARYVEAGRDTGRHYADIDPESYVVLIMLLVITATASSPVTAAALDQGGRDGEARFDRELARIARASLFPPSPPPDPARRAKQATQSSKPDPHAMEREPEAAHPIRSPKRKSAR